MSADVLDSELVSDSPAPGDSELVERFVVARDHQAFATLVHRHGPVVLGVCRRVLRDPHDMEDVFQTTFLVFVRDAASVRKRSSLASWMYGVAYRLALRTARQKHRRRETALADDALIGDTTIQRVIDRHDQQIVDAELNAIPENYRQPLVLRYLLGKSPGEIASELKMTTGAVDGLLKRGKNELRTRLLKRGITSFGILATVQLAQRSLHGAEANALMQATIDGGLSWELGSSTLPTDLFSDLAVELAGKQGIAMTAATKTTLTIGLAAGAIVAGFGASAMLGGGPGRQAQASGINTTLPATRAVHDGAELAIVAAASNDPDGDRGAENKAIAADDLGTSTIGNVATNQTTTGGADGSATKDADQNMNPPGNPKAHWDFKSKSPQAMKIERALQANTEVNFTDIPLKDALDYLGELHQIQIWVDTKALSDEGVSADNTVNLVASGIGMKSVMRLILEPLLLDTYIRNDMLIVTTRTITEDHFETRVYRTGRLPNLTAKELVEIITTSIEPNSWVVRTSDAGSPDGKSTQINSADQTKSKENAGPGQPAANGGNGSAQAVGNILVVRQTQRVHDEIAELLNQLEQQASESPVPAAREGANRRRAPATSSDDLRRDSGTADGSSSSTTTETRQRRPRN